MKPLVYFSIGIILITLLEVARVYFIMPFPGSQLDDAVNVSRVAVAYWLHNNSSWIRILSLGILVWPATGLTQAVREGRLSAKRGVARWWPVGVAGVLTGAYGMVLYLVNAEMMADRMFLQPTTKRLMSLAENKIPANKLVLGVYQNGEARAYPLQLIGYHHQVRDTVGGKPVMITYCTVCRTGRVYDPMLNGKNETFRLVGMDHFNAMFEDEATGSWWRQATGEAILGPRKGQILSELAAPQMTLAEWSAAHPNTLVMQPDPAFKSETDSLATYDLGVKRGKLTGRDSTAWQRKSWVVGVVGNDGKTAKAFDWNQLVKQRVVNNSVGNQPIVIVLAPDKLSFLAWNRVVQGGAALGQVLTFAPTADNQLTDRETNTIWNRQGIAVSGKLAGQQLVSVRAYQEFWHSWRSFHPKTQKSG